VGSFCADHQQVLYRLPDQPEEYPGSRGHASGHNRIQEGYREPVRCGDA